MLIWFICMVAFLISISLMLISYFMSIKNNFNMEKFSSFECGFLNFSKLRSPFSLRFFLIALIFLIFDIEIIFVFPISMCQFNMLNYFISINIVMFIIFYGLIHEWLSGSLTWSK